MTVQDNGNVGIGTTSPTQKLHVARNILATGSITEGSSRDYKENVSTLDAGEALEPSRVSSRDLPLQS